MRAGRGWGRGRSGQECGCGWMREAGGAGAQEWEGGGLDALRGAGGCGAGSGGGGTRGNERVRQQRTKHCRRWREGPSASGG